MGLHPAHGRAQVVALMGVTCALLVAAVVVRGIPGARPAAPEDKPDGPEALGEPMQFLSSGASRRMRELAPRIDPARSADWNATWRLPFELQGCPRLMEWLNGPDGLRMERLIGELRRGSRDESLAALALLVQLARSTDWAPGLMAHTEHAERLGGLLQDWLRVWAPKSAEDAQLLEPALAAALLYGRVMRMAYLAPTFGRADAPYDRARLFLDEISGARSGRRTAFGERLAARYPRAWTTLDQKSDFLSGSSEEARLLFPEIDGECGG